MEMLRDATIRIEKSCGNAAKKSSIYKTAAWGYTDQPDFYNQCILLQTEFSAEQLMQVLLNIETEMGRVRTE